MADKPLQYEQVRKQLLERNKQVNVALDPKDEKKTQSASAPGWFADDAPLFSPPRNNNDAAFFTTGVEYYADVAKAIKGASEHVWIAGWQVAWDVELDKFGSGSTRLVDCLLEAKKSHPDIDLRVMLFRTKSNTPAIDDDNVAATLRSVGIKACRVWPNSAFSESAFSYYSHHQKTVIIDRKTAYIGGIDLTHGRRDDGDFVVQVDPKIRRINEAYSGCVPHTRTLEKDEQDWVKLSTKPGGARDIYDGTGKILDYKTRPRQPWQDVHMKLSGPSVFDIAANYVRRWNGLVSGDDSIYQDDPDGGVSPDAPAAQIVPAEYWITQIGPTKLSDFTPDSLPKDGGAKVQILRSVSNQENIKEYASQKTPINLLGELTPGQRSAKKRDAPSHQYNIQEAMVRAILGAQHFVYIENQYFISHFGAEQLTDANGRVILRSKTENDTSTPYPQSPELAHGIELRSYTAGVALSTVFSKEMKDVQNVLVAALGQRIRDAVLKGEPFHVFLMIPLHSEGLLSDTFNMAVMHQTMQTITFGAESLINRIRRAIAEKQVSPKKPSEVKDFEEQVRGVETEKWQKYLTLLCARNFDLLSSGRLVTEQIYVHSKCLVADDRVAIIGSANINDRSVMGDRDTEIAAMVVDTETSTKPLDGKNAHPVRNFAHELRVALWKKHLGLSKNGKAGPLPASSLESLIEKPAATETIAAIQKLVEANSAAYEQAFPWVPRNKDNRKRAGAKGNDPVPEMGSSIWPGWRSKEDDHLQPWSDKFEYPSGDAAKNVHSQLQSAVKGFWCAFPYLWTQGQENLDAKIPIEFISKQEPPKPARSDGDSGLASADTEKAPAT